MFRKLISKKGISRFSAALVVLLLVVLAAAPVYGFDIPKQSKAFYVNDKADILSEDTESYIVKVNESLYSKCGAQVVVATVPNLQGASVEEFATAMFRKYGIGSKEKNNGLLILLAMEEKKCRIEVGYGLEGALNDAKTGRIQDEYMIPYFKDGKWDEGIKNGFDAFLVEIGKEYDTEVSSDAPVSMLPKEEGFTENANNMGIVCMVIATIVGLIMGKMRSKLKFLLMALSLIGITVYISIAFGILWAVIVLFGSGLFQLIGWAITSPDVGSGSSGGGYSSRRDDDYYGSYSSRSSSSSSSSSSSHYGGGGSSGGGGSTRGW